MADISAFSVDTHISQLRGGCQERRVSLPRQRSDHPGKLVRNAPSDPWGGTGSWRGNAEAPSAAAAKAPPAQSLQTSAPLPTAPLSHGSAATAHAASEIASLIARLEESERGRAKAEQQLELKNADCAVELAAKDAELAAKNAEVEDLRMRELVWQQSAAAVHAAALGPPDTREQPQERERQHEPAGAREQRPQFIDAAPAAEPPQDRARVPAPVPPCVSPQGPARADAAFAAGPLQDHADDAATTVQPPPPVAGAPVGQAEHASIPTSPPRVGAIDGDVSLPAPASSPASVEELTAELHNLSEGRISGLLVERLFEHLRAFDVPFEVDDSKVDIVTKVRQLRRWQALTPAESKTEWENWTTRTHPSGEVGVKELVQSYYYKQHGRHAAATGGNATTATPKAAVSSEYSSTKAAAPSQPVPLAASSPAPPSRLYSAPAPAPAPAEKPCPPRAAPATALRASAAAPPAAAVPAAAPPPRNNDEDLAAEVARISAERPWNWRGILGIQHGEEACHDRRYRQLMKVLHPDKRTESGELLAGGREQCDDAIRIVQCALEMAKTAPRYAQGKAPAQAAPQTPAWGGCSAATASAGYPRAAQAQAQTQANARLRRPSPPPLPEGDLSRAMMGGPMPPPHPVTGRLFLQRI